MNLIFIEAKNANTSECNFLKAVLSKHFADKSVEFICMNGVGNLFQKSIINRMEQAQVEGDSVLVLVDADSPSKGWGYTKRHDDIEAKKAELQLNFPLLTSSSCHPKIFVKEFCYFLMSCHQHGLGVNLLVQR